MTYIKKLVLKGFKSFAKETSIDFSDSMNVIVGPNGSGKSNITDAICFVLGRMSIKSMRAAKASNLIFAGTKQYKPVSEASVKLILDNSDKKLSQDKDEIEIERIVRKNRQSLYRIDNETKTRQEVLELLAQAEIDPYGFNIILQGEISSIVKMHGEERRKIIEEVAGISIYESRKEKSLRELEKTDERLKEVSTTLRERTAYLKNLEEERKQALRYKKLQEIVKQYKASIIRRKLVERQKELSDVEKQQVEREKIKEKEKNKERDTRNSIEQSQEQINKINSQIQKASGIEQESLNREIADFRARLAGLDVQKESSLEKIEEIISRRNRIKSDIEKLKLDIENLREHFPSQAKKQQQLEVKKNELEKIEEEKDKFYKLREKLISAREGLKNKENILLKIKNQISFILKETDKISESLTYADETVCSENLKKFREEQKKNREKLNFMQKQINENEKLIFSDNKEVENLRKIKSQVGKMDICPLCKSKMTEEHVKEVFKESDAKISELTKKSKESESIVQSCLKELEKIKERLNELELKIPETEINLINLRNIESKKQQIKSLSEEQNSTEKEISSLNKNVKIIEKQIFEFKDTEERYDKIFFEIQEISARTKENISLELDMKERDLEKSKLLIRQFDREEQELKEGLGEIEKDIKENNSGLEEKEKEEEILENKNRELINRRINIEKEIHENNTLLLKIQNNISNVDAEINNLKIEIARLKAEKENFETDFEIYKGIKIINFPAYALEERLNKTQQILDNIGNVNLRALEVYDKMKGEYDVVAEKVSVLEKEKEEVLKIIEEIDKKKIKTFKKTLNAISELFNRNFTQLYTKGEAFLELENKEEPFSAGLDIIIKVGKGKYFDVTSLSGGEQTLVALSLIFAIQEYKPYSFYILDEVDAALDKRNSERLSSLIKRYMKTGQYIIITHNDAIITESNLLYGVSMQEGLSKILSLEV